MGKSSSFCFFFVFGRCSLIWPSQMGSPSIEPRERLQSNTWRFPKIGASWSGSPMIVGRKVVVHYLGATNNQAPQEHTGKGNLFSTRQRPGADPTKGGWLIQSCRQLSLLYVAWWSICHLRCSPPNHPLYIDGFSTHFWEPPYIGFPQTRPSTNSGSSNFLRGSSLIVELQACRPM